MARACEAAAKLLERVNGITNVKIVENLVRFDFAGDDRQAAQLLKLLQQAALPVCWMREVELDLEQMFIRVTGRSVPGAVNGKQAG